MLLSSFFNGLLCTTAESFKNPASCRVSASAAVLTAQSVIILLHPSLCFLNQNCSFSCRLPVQDEEIVNHNFKMENRNQGKQFKFDVVLSCIVLQREVWCGWATRTQMLSFLCRIRMWGWSRCGTAQRCLLREQMLRPSLRARLLPSLTGATSSSLKFTSKILLTPCEHWKFHTSLDWMQDTVFNVCCFRDSSGAVTSLEGRLNLENTDYKKTTKITWLAETPKAPFTPTVCVNYQHLITKPVLSKDDNFKDYINPNSKVSDQAIGSQIP